MSFKKIGLFGHLIVLSALGMSCVSTAPTETVTELEFDLASHDATASHWSVYLGETANEAVVTDHLADGDIRMYLFSDLIHQQEYMMTYPNSLSEADRATLPLDSPLHDSTVMPITEYSMSESAHPDTSLVTALTRAVKDFDHSLLDSTKTEPYIITDTYTESFDSETALRRQITINPKTNLPLLVELINPDDNTVVERFTVSRYETTTRQLDLEDWKNSLPGQKHVVLHDDLK